MVVIYSSIRSRFSIRSVRHQDWVVLRTIIVYVGVNSMKTCRMPITAIYQVHCTIPKAGGIRWLIHAPVHLCLCLPQFFFQSKEGSDPFQTFYTSCKIFMFVQSNTAAVQVSYSPYNIISVVLETIGGVHIPYHTTQQLMYLLL